MISGKKVFPDPLRLNAVHAGKFNSVADLPQNPAEVAFIGRSNSGKSSLLKSLLNCPNPPQVSARPGSTRLMHVYQLGTEKASLGGLALVDFPGYGYAQSAAFFRARFSQMLVEYLAVDRPVKALFLIMDCRRDVQEEETEIARIAKERRIPLILCLNKADQLNQSETVKMTRKFADTKSFFEIVLISAQKRQNLEYLRNYIASLG